MRLRHIRCVESVYSVNNLVNKRHNYLHSMQNHGTLCGLTVFFILCSYSFSPCFCPVFLSNKGNRKVKLNVLNSYSEA